MCGIFGIVAPGIPPAFLESATATLTHRGPDDAGYYIDDHIALGHRRLSIIDRAGSHQPLFNEDRTRCIVFNGEIYNYTGLHKRLSGLGHDFSTTGDTETILHAYEEWGEGCVEHLSGMFAFAIWDSKARTLFMARDRFGIKPLYYGSYQRGFCFASEMKAILNDQEFPRDIDDRAFSAYFSLGYIPGDATIYSGIRKLLPGHTLTLRAGDYRIRNYWNLKFEPDHTTSEHRITERTMELLEDAVGTHLVSEVPIGAFLSGGIDSGTVVALMNRRSKGTINTFCMGFGGDTAGCLDERGYARQVAERYETLHIESELRPDCEGIVDTIVTAFDEPFADDSAIPSYFVCKTARKYVTVALSGLGGDELFAGYERHLGHVLGRRASRLPSFLLTRLLEPLARWLTERSDGTRTMNHIKRFVRSATLPPGERYFGYLNRIPPDMLKEFFCNHEHATIHHTACRELVTGHYHSENVAAPPDSLDRALYCDIKTWLPEDILCVTDRMSMQHGLEVRVPFLDHAFVEFCASIPEEMKIRLFSKKHLLKKAAGSLLPREVISHRKQGFVGPLARWLKSDLKPFVLETLTSANLRRHGMICDSAVRRVIDEHFSNRENHDALIWSLVIFQHWHDKYIHRR